MPYRASEMKETFNVDATLTYSGDYGYGKTLNYKDRYSHDPWTWWHLVEKDNYPHMTTYADDFAGKPSELKKFHMTFNHSGNIAMPVHIHYKIEAGKAVRTGVDAKRCNSSETEARDVYFNNKARYDKLAQKFIENVFP